MRVQTQNNKNQESTILAKLHSATSKCHLSATKLLVEHFIHGIVGERFFMIFILWQQAFNL